MFAVQAPAVNVTITDVTTAQTATPSTGILDISGDPVPTAWSAGKPDFIIWTFTLTGADLDGEADAADQMQWTIITTASTTTGTGLCCPALVGPFVGVASEGALINARMQANATDWETATLAAGAVTYGLDGDPITTLTGSFVKFTGLHIDNLAAGALNVNGTSYSVDADLIGQDYGGTLTLACVPTSGNWRFRNYDFEVSTDAPPSGITLDTLTAADIGATNATLGATIQSGENVTSYGTGWYMPGGSTNSLAIVDSPTIPPVKIFSHEQTGMTPGTLCNFGGWASNVAEGVVWSTNESSFLTEPEQASDVVITPLTDTSMTVSWTTNTGSAGSLVLMRQGPSTTSVPADDTTYGANSVFGTAGTELGYGYVVYSGSGTTVDVTGLTTNTTYHMAVFAYAEEGGFKNYQQDSPAVAAQYADYVRVYDWDGLNAAMADNGPLVSGVTTGALGSSSIVGYTFTLTGADLDGGGETNDSMTWTFTLIAETTGTNPVVCDAGGSVGYFGVRSSLHTDTLINDGETLKVVPGPVVCTLNGGTVQHGSFLGFDAAVFHVANNAGGHPWTFDGGLTSSTAGGMQVVDLLGVPVLECEWVTGTGANYQRMRIMDLIFRVSTKGGITPDSGGMFLLVR